MKLPKALKDRLDELANLLNQCGYHLHTSPDAIISEAIYVIRRQKDLLAEADRVINKSKQDLENYLSIPDYPIKVLPNE